MNEKALVVLSGGQDSTTCVYWAIERFGREQVSSVTFDYGQRHRIELDCAKEIAEFAGISNVILPIDTFAALGGNALTDSDIAVESVVNSTSSLPNTFVPGRNLVFLTFAAALAYQRGITHLVTGVAQTDYSGYPDCREETLRLLQEALRKGMESQVQIHTPLMHLSKKETVAMANALGALPAMALTHTCYNGERPPCGHCAACKLRAKGFVEAGIADPLLG
ncbi:MAG: 7-cyano-7-deazaguanine synthase QueC [Gammaproteobacteria bacterium]|nr:7-cyano-7-deazaguanine synthase QueC [Gammaproteobacteria bacterium]MDH5260926.1 7-cyano-7-deazaguanine synthase QueC [Gammaproteobacteria bacterium]